MWVLYRRGWKIRAKQEPDYGSGIAARFDRMVGYYSLGASGWPPKRDDNLEPVRNAALRARLAREELAGCLCVVFVGPVPARLVSCPDNTCRLSWGRVGAHVEVAQFDIGVLDTHWSRAVAILFAVTLEYVPVFVPVPESGFVFVSVSASASASGFPRLWVYCWQRAI